MLALTRRRGQSVVLDPRRLEITVVDVESGTPRRSSDAPAAVDVGAGIWLSFDGEGIPGPVVVRLADTKDGRSFVDAGPLAGLLVPEVRVLTFAGIAFTLQVGASGRRPWLRVEAPDAIDAPFLLSAHVLEDGSVRLGIEAPRSVRVCRSELLEEISAANVAALGADDDALVAFVRAAGS